MKELEAKGFNFVGSEEYQEKRAIANGKCGYETPEEEKLDRQTSVEAALKVYRRTLPILLNRLNKINDPRQPKKLKHSLTVLMIYGILMFVYQQSSLRNANKEMSTAIFFENMKAMFPDYETIPHADTLSRLLERIKVEKIEESMLELFEQLVEYTYGNNGRCKERLHVVVCEETWEETSRMTGKTTSNSTRYVWISGKELTKTNVETRCLKIGRYRWSELLEKKVTVLGINGLLAYIFKACTADVLDLNRITSIVNDNSYQWRLAS